MQTVELVLMPEMQEKYNPNMSSLFHGFLMELIDSSYAGFLHKNGFKPYSQYIIRGASPNEWIWRINTLTEEAFERISKPLLEYPYKSITLKEKQLALTVVKKEVKEKISYGQLVRGFYLNAGTKRALRIKFITPCSFKSSGTYVFYPDFRLIYQSLMNKFDSFSDQVSVKDKEVLDYLYGHTKIIGYNLRSSRFHLNGVRIPSFLGEVFFRIEGPETLANLANLLLSFGCWAGVGIKTSLGMGAITIE